MCWKRMHRLVSVSAEYMSGESYISYGITPKRRVLFLVVEHNLHAGRMRSSIGSVINSILGFRSTRF